MVKDIKNWQVLKRGILGSLSGTTSNIIIQKNNVIKIKPLPKKK